MKSLIKVSRERKRQIVQLAAKWRWVGLSFVGLGLFSLEVYEYIELKFLSQPFHLGEIFLYGILLLVSGMFVELFVRSNRGNEKLLKILEYKHNLSLELLLNDDVESLLSKLVELPGRIADVDEAYILVRASWSGRFEVAEHWKSETGKGDDLWNPLPPCPMCLEKIPNANGFHMCESEPDTRVEIYSLRAVTPEYPSTIIRFKMRSGARMLREEEKIFRNIGDDIAVALLASQDRKKLLEMQVAEVAMAERRMVFGYVHDQLGQNLGYLQLKLDQLGANPMLVPLKNVQGELKQLRDVANQSYEIVRDILKKMQAESIPNLGNLLKEHARAVAERARFTLNFECTGVSVKFPSETQQIIFFVFGEILNNIEKHAMANRVDVLLDWSEEYLDISVADNGVGFETSRVDTNEHFGLEIMNERISFLKGKFIVDSSLDKGTVVTISVPIHEKVRSRHEQ